MIIKEFHRRGRQPGRKVIASKDGRVYYEHVDAIVMLYVQDRMSIADITRLYGAVNATGIGKICRRGRDYISGKSSRASDDRYFETTARYAMALDMLERKRTWTYRAIAHEVGMRTGTVRMIAERNGLERKQEDRDG